MINNMQPTKIEISHRTIIFTFLFVLGLWLVYQIRDILLILFVSSMAMAALEPLIRKLELLKLPRGIAILLIYIFLVLFLGIAVVGITPPLVDQTAILINKLPALFKQVELLGIDRNLINGQISQLGSVPVNLLNFFVGLFSNLATGIVVAVLTFYLLMERKNLSQYLTRFLGKPGEKEILEIIEKIEKRLGFWIRAELILMTFVGLLSYFGFRLLAMDFALPLAIIAGFLEVIPNFGPTIATVPAVLAGLAISPVHGLAALAWSFLVQQIENNFLVPKVMARTTGLNPLVTILSLSIGFKLAGIAGATLAIPVVLALEVIFTELYLKKTSGG